MINDDIHSVNNLVEKDLSYLPPILVYKGQDEEKICRIKNVFCKLENPMDIFRIINNCELDNTKNYQFIISQISKCGIDITSYRCSKLGPYQQRDGVSIFVNYSHENNASNYPFYISSYSFHINGTQCGNSLTEEIYSNRTEYYINNEFISYHKKNIDSIIKYINTKILDDKVYPWLYDLITRDNKQNELIVINREIEDKVNISISDFIIKNESALDLHAVGPKTNDLSSAKMIDIMNNMCYYRNHKNRILWTETRFNNHKSYCCSGNNLKNEPDLCDNCKQILNIYSLNKS